MLAFIRKNKLVPSKLELIMTEQSLFVFLKRSVHERNVFFSVKYLKVNKVKPLPNL